MHSQASVLLLLVVSAAVLTVVRPDDEFCEPIFTKKEAKGFVDAWCKKEEFIVTFMNRKIECRNKFWVSSDYRQCLKAR